MKQKKVWILCGIPGSGKTTWAKSQHLSCNDKCAYISRDEIRFRFTAEDEAYFSRETEVYDEFISEIQQAIDDKDIVNVLVDATHLNEKSRMKTINRLSFVPQDVAINAVFFKVPLDVCLQRNDSRKGRAVVPHDVIRNMAKSCSSPTTDKFDYDIIYIINEQGAIEQVYDRTLEVVQIKK